MKQSAILLLSRWSPKLATKACSTALNAYRSGDYGKALATFRVLADRNYPDVQAILASMYRDGHGTPVDHVEAVKWSRLAADSGHAEAAFNLGVSYEDGIGISSDLDQALHWYRLSAQQGYAGAQINLAHCFHDGLGVTPDEFLAAWWITHAAGQGVVDAQLNLGLRYLYGVGVDQDWSQALFWLNLAAMAGSDEAITQRGNITQHMTPGELGELERGWLTAAWKPKTAADSAFEIFAFAARQTIVSLMEVLGEERFASLRTTERDWPSIGEVILNNTHGLTLPKIASNLRNHVEQLDRSLDLKLAPGAQTNDEQCLPTPKTFLGFIRRIDDLADVAAVIGERTAEISQNLIEYQLSLVRELERVIDSESIATLLKRFSVRQGLRASRLIEHSGLQRVLLPIHPW